MNCPKHSGTEQVGVSSLTWAVGASGLRRAPWSVGGRWVAVGWGHVALLHGSLEPPAGELVCSQGRSRGEGQRGEGQEASAG